ncbi:ParE family toxin-like protein [Enterobacter cloacae]|uniref:ParE family toxin-like protein n=1 Tax=Enterobacter cloacae TaxID=550 RepID=UPI004032D435
MSWLSSSKNKKWRLRKRRVMKWGDLMALTAIRIPEWVHLKAVHVLSQFRARRIHPCRMQGSGNLSLKVNHRWRLLSRDGGKNWEVMSHERYSKVKDRK